MSSAGGCCMKFVHYLFDYETPVMLVIKSKRVGAIFRFIQLLIILYVIVYVCWMQKGYQDTDIVISSVTTKVKGTAMTNISFMGIHIWDVTEYVIPPQEENSVFVVTNVIVTPNQLQSKCPEVPGPSCICSSDSECTAGLHDARGNGVQTGLCVNYSDTIKTCEVYAWCPFENDTQIPEPALLESAEDFTVLIKNNIQYPKFRFKKQNILPYINSTYLKNCTFNRNTDPDCPIFRLGDILAETGDDFPTMAVKGGVIGILINWNCDLDMSEALCVPKYSFSRMDNKNNAAPGYNFRYAKYFKKSENIETRTLVKAYGIRFDILVFGKAGKFSAVHAIVNIGATLAFLSLVNAVCDWFMLTFMKKRHDYAKHKFIYLDTKENGEDLQPIGNTYGTH